MRKLLLINLAIISTLLFSSCGTTNNVVSNRLISKRKYTKGFHVNKRSKQKDSDGKKEEALYADKVEKRKKTSKTEDISLPTKRSTSVEEHNNQELAERESYESATESGYQYGEDSPMTDSFTDEMEAAPKTSGAEEESRVENEENAEMQNRPDTSDPVMLVLLIILAIIIPPLAIIIYSGPTNWFWIDLVLFLLAIGGFFWNPAVGAIGLAAVIIAFLVIFDVI